MSDCPGEVWLDPWSLCEHAGQEPASGGNLRGPDTGHPLRGAGIRFSGPRHPRTLARCMATWNMSGLKSGQSVWCL
jgi:hypothetical protein